MGEGYVKLFNSIIVSSVWQEEDTTRLLWITMLALADKAGHVIGSTPGLAHLARIPVKACEKALAILAAPDPNSQNPANEGRRIAQAERGWVILNYAEFRKRLSKEDRREYKRIKEAEYRAARKLSTLSTSGPTGHKQRQNAEADSRGSTTVSTETVGRNSANESRRLPDSEWLESLKKEPAYAGIDIPREFSKMENWCRVKKKTASRQRFINWLNRIETPMNGQHTKASAPKGTNVW